MTSVGPHTSGQGPGGFGDLAPEDAPAVEHHLHLLHPPEGVNSRLVVVPHADHGHLVGGPEVQEYGVAAARGEGRQPQVHVVLGAVDAVNQVGNHTRVLAVRREDVYVRRVGVDVGRLHGLPAGAEHLQAVEADVVAVAPGGQDVEDQSLALRQHGDLKVVLRLGGRVVVVIGSVAQSPCSVDGMEGAPGCGRRAERGDRGAADLALQELIKDVSLETHVGDAAALTLVEFGERVPGLHEGLVLAAVQLGQRGTEPPAGRQQRQRLLWRTKGETTSQFVDV